VGKSLSMQLMGKSQKKRKKSSFFNHSFILRLIYGKS
jgi:hypothetical protein